MNCAMATLRSPAVCQQAVGPAMPRAWFVRSQLHTEGWHKAQYSTVGLARIENGKPFLDQSIRAVKASPPRPWELAIVEIPLVSSPVMVGPNCLAGNIRGEGTIKWQFVSVYLHMARAIFHIVRIVATGHASWLHYAPYMQVVWMISWCTTSERLDQKLSFGDPGHSRCAEGLGVYTESSVLRVCIQELR